jgi:hypothetical protein
LLKEAQETHKSLGFFILINKEIIKQKNMKTRTKYFKRIVHIALSVAMVIWSVAPGLSSFAPTARAFATVDNTNPTVSITLPADGTVIHDPSFSNLNFTASDNLSTTIYWSRFVDGVIDGAPNNPMTSGASVGTSVSSPLLNGPHTIEISVSDAAGNTATAAIHVTLDAPEITATFYRQGPGDHYAKVGDIVQVSFVANEPVTPPDSMIIAGHAIPSYQPQGGNNFYIYYTMLASDIEGPLTYSLTAHDAAGNSTTVSGGGVTFDKTAPTITVPDDYIVEATSGSGAILNYVASATDVNPATPEVTCVPPSGSTFPLGTTTVTCSATDSAGNIGTNTFNVTVNESVDTAPTVESTQNDTSHTPQWWTTDFNFILANIDFGSSGKKSAQYKIDDGDWHDIALTTWPAGHTHAGEIWGLHNNYSAGRTYSQCATSQ